MGWFVIACIFGSLGYWKWRLISNRNPNAAVSSVIFAFGIVFVGLILWAILSQDARTIGQIADALHHGRVARFLLGLVLGAGIAFTIAENSRAQSDDGDVTVDSASDAETSQSTGDAGFLLGLILGAGGALGMAGDSRSQTSDGGATGNSSSIPAPSRGNDRSAPTGPGGARGLPAHLVLSLGLGILFLALTAPYIDGWFQRLTALKSPLIELQLASSSTHRISVAEGLETLFNSYSLEYLQTYSSKIQTDIEYLDKYGRGVPSRDSITASARKLLPTFNRIVSPIATCIQTAIKGDWLSIESARKIIMPTTDLLEQIIFGEDTLQKSNQLDAKDDAFWRSIVKLPKTIRSRVSPLASLSDPVCSDVPQTYWEEDQDTMKTLFPKFRNYENVPYLYVTSALLISFTGDSDKALRVLQRANDLQKAAGQPKLDFKDFYFLFTSARLSYYQGKPGDLSKLYFGDLDMLRTTSLERIKVLERAKQECVFVQSLPCRERTYEIAGTNLAAYFLAEDLARSSGYAAGYAARLQEFAEEIKRAVDEADRLGPAANGYYSWVQTNKYNLLDTYAYATLVLEARKPSPDYDLIKREVVSKLRSVVEHFEEAIKNQHRIDRIELAGLRVAQAHLESARDLVGQ